MFQVMFRFDQASGQISDSVDLGKSSKFKVLVFACLGQSLLTDARSRSVRRFLPVWDQMEETQNLFVETLNGTIYIGSTNSAMVVAFVWLQANLISNSLVRDLEDATGLR